MDKDGSSGEEDKTKEYYGKKGRVQKGYLTVEDLGLEEEILGKRDEDGKKKGGSSKKKYYNKGQSSS